jgi:hypothetical protein
VVRAERVRVLVEPAAQLSDGGAFRQPVAESPTTIVEQWRAFAGFTIDVQPLATPEVAHLARQVQVIGYLLALPATLGWALQLRITAAPALAAPGSVDARAQLSLTLLCAASGPTAELANDRAREVAAAVELAGRFLAPTYEVRPITELAVLKTSLEPFQLDDVVEIQRRHLSLRAGETVLSAPVALPTFGGFGQWLCEALVGEATRRRRPLGWFVTLESADVSSIERLALQRAEHLALASLAREWPAASGDGAISISTGEPSPPLAHIGPVLGAQWQTLAGLVGRVQACLVADQPMGVPPSLIAAAISDCSDSGTAAGDGSTAPAVARRALRSPELIRARRALAELRCSAWSLAGNDDGEQLDSLEVGRGGGNVSELIGHLVDPLGAAALFRVPVPGPFGLPGLPVERRPREAWLLTPSTSSDGGLLLGDNVAGRARQPIVLSADDRRRHLYVVGQTGTGKSTLLLNCITEDLQAGRGVAVLDPHGDLIEAILACVPRERLADVVLVDPSDREHPVGFNFLECSNEDEQHQVAESFIGMLYQLFDSHHTGIIGPRFEHAARNAMLTAMAGDDMTLVEVVRVLTDPSFVRTLLPKVKDPMVRRYWTDQIAQTSDFHKSEVLDYIVSKFSPFVHNPLLRNIIGQGRSTFSLRTIMDDRKILLINLTQGRLGSKLSTFLGMVLVAKFVFAAFSRVDIPEAQRHDFALYVDEFQNYASPAFIDMISGARKYHLSVTMAHQHVAQLPPDVSHAVFGNVGTLVALRVGVRDAALLAEALQPSTFAAADFIELPNFRSIAQVLAHGRRGAAFSLSTRPGPEIDDGMRDWAEEVRAASRLSYGRPRDAVEVEVARRANL